MEPGTYTVPEASKRFGCSKNHLYELIARGELPGVIRLGKKILLSRRIIDEMIEPRAE
jgi:excisionase family DNA binding protein